jgi:hypothetical protein
MVDAEATFAGSDNGSLDRLEVRGQTGSLRAHCVVDRRKKGEVSLKA